MQIEYFKNQLDFLNNINSAECYFLFIPENEEINLEKFNKLKVKIYGAIFPDIIYKNSSFKTGLLSFKINLENKIFFIKDKENYEFKVEDFKEVKSVVTILEGFKEGNDDFLYKLFENLEINTNIAGGAAGLLGSNRKVFFDNHGFYNDCVVLITTNIDINVSSKHGWKYLKGPFIATSCEGNRIKSIDYRPAFEVYKEIIESQSNIKLTNKNFFDISKNYPLGVIKFHGEYLIRDLLSFENDELILVNKVEENSVINILFGKKNNLIDAAVEAIKKTKVSLDVDYLIFTCITRKIFLDNKFQDELQEIYTQTNNANLLGVTTLGEIANEGNKHIDFLNKTCVVASYVK